MEFNEAVQLINIPELAQESSQVWADLGAGSGLFSFAIAELLPSNSTVYAVDKYNTPLLDIRAPRSNQVIPLHKDFRTEDLGLEPLDGVIAANALHFVPDLADCIEKIMKQLKPGAPWIIVEYDMYEPSRWVPHPLPYVQLADLFHPFGYHTIRKTGKKPSVYNSSTIYSAWVAR